jgi:hypothetical protein
MIDILTNLLQDGKITKYPSFKDYCVYKGKGLRKKAMHSINLFIKEFENWEPEKQKEFVNWIFPLFERSEDINSVLIHPIEENLLKPVLKRLIDEEPENPQPFKWYGLYLNTENHMELLKRALELGGKKEQAVLQAIIDSYIYSLWYSFHHISEDLYLGDVMEDKITLQTLEMLCLDVRDSETKKNISTTINYYNNLLNDWIFSKDESKKGFVKWCAKHGKEYEWTNTYYY